MKAKAKMVNRVPGFSRRDAEFRRQIASSDWEDPENRLGWTSPEALRTRDSVGQFLRRGGTVMLAHTRYRPQGDG